MRERLATMRTFIEQVYIPDVLLVASAYPEWTKIGGGTRNFLTYGGYGRGPVSDTATYLFPRGIIRDLDLSRVLPVNRSRSPSRWHVPGIATRKGTGRRCIPTGRDRGHLHGACAAVSVAAYRR